MPGSALKSVARRLIFQNAPRIFLISLIYVTLTALVSWLAVRLPGSISMSGINSRLASGEIPSLAILYSDFRPIGVFLAILMFMLQPFLDVGFMSICLKVKREVVMDIKDLFNGFIFFIKVLTIFLITTIYIFLWSLLLIIPGIIAAYRYRQAYYILIDDPRKSALQCISESALIINGRKLDLFIIDISFIGWFALDIIVYLLIPLPFAIPVVSIWLSLYLGLTRAAFYEDLISGAAV